MFGLLGGLAMMAFGLGCEAHDTAKAVRASCAFETAPTLSMYCSMDETAKKEVQDAIIRCKRKGIPLTQNQAYIYYNYMVDRDENGNAIERY